MTSKRREAINQYIQSRGEVQFKDLEEHFDYVSGMTIRRDLEFLERQGQIVRIRGGARSLASLSMIKEAAYTQRQIANADAKDLIGQKAVSLLSQGRSIYIDSGTTCMSLARQLPDQSMFILTPAPNIALELIKNPSARVNLTGGQLNRETLTLSGFNAVEYVKTLNLDLAFIAASAFSPDNGFSCGDYLEAELKKLIIRKARQTAILMDSSKLGSSMPYTFARLTSIYALVCEQALPEEYEKAARKAHVLLP